jgi:hypothetical protein
MMVALRAALLGYAAVWAVLLIACLRKRQFCPIFGDSHKTRLCWLATFVLVNPLLTILYLVFGQIRSPQARPVRVVRELVLLVALLGFFVNVPGLTHLWMQPFLGRSARAGQTAQAHLAAIQAANNTSMTSASSSSDNSRFACRRIAVILEGDHPFLYRVGSGLVQQLRKLPGVETVEFQTQGAFPASGQRAPDIFVRLYLNQFHENLVPYSLRLSAQIDADVGRMPLRSTHSYHDSFTPPLLAFNLQVGMSHQSTTTGYESVRYTLAAQNVAKDLGGQIGKTFGQWRDKYGLLPELPAEFYGPYTGPELPEPLQKLKPVRLGSYAGLLVHSETYSQFRLDDEPVQALAALRDAMTASGWKELSGDWNLPRLSVRWAQANRRIHVFQMPRHEPFRGTRMTFPASEPEPACLFGIVDEERFRSDELHATLDRLLAEPLSVERLMLFERMFDKQQEQRWLTILARQPPRDVLTQIRLGELYQRRDQPEKALQALKRARALLWAVREDRTYTDRLKRLAEKLGDKKLAEAVPTREDFLDAGFPELALDGGPVEIETNLNVPAIVFFAEPQGGCGTLALTVVPAGGEKGTFGVTYAKRTAHGSSSGSCGGISSQANGHWQYDLPRGFVDDRTACRITRIGNEDRFKISIRSTPGETGRAD